MTFYAEPVITVAALRALVRHWQDLTIKARLEGPLVAIALDLCAHDLTVVCDAADPHKPATPRPPGRDDGRRV